MKVQLVAVGTKMPGWVQAGYQEYAKRLPKDLLPTVVEIPIGHRAKNSSQEEAKRQEGDAIIEAVPPQYVKVMMHTQGQPWSTEQLAEKLANWRMEGRNLSFVIGGPDGYSDECLAQADGKWCLSNLTLPHPIVRVVFIEQLYRAWSILQSHPYHK